MERQAAYSAASRVPISSVIVRALDKLRTSGNLDEVEHTSANRRCYDDEIATLRSQ